MAPVQVALLDYPVATPESAGRSPGLHVSRIIRNIAIEAKILKIPVDVDTLSLREAGTEEFWASLPEGDRLRMSIGLAWEAWYIPHLQDVVDHPGEMACEGIFMTHDGESLDVVYREGREDHLLAVHEIKATYKSTKTVGNLDTQWMWLAQIKAYCHGLGTRLAYLHVLFVNGDYSYPMTPKLKVWRLEFTDDEIAENWELLTSYARHHEAMEREALMKDTYDAR